MLAKRSPASSPEVPAALTRWTQDIDRELRRLVPPAESLLRRMVIYHLGWADRDGRPINARGKHVRSSLCCWAAEACGTSGHAVLPAACALELIHNFTLVHDDVQDEDEERRGRPTVWTVWGRAQAINAGDCLFALAMQTLLEDCGECLSTSGVHGPVVRAARVLLTATSEMVDGQCADLAGEGHPETLPETYMRLIEAKTGALLGASLEIGGILAGASPGVCEQLRRAGRQLGVAFQLRDDWLGAWGESVLTGKSSSSDLERRKLTHAVVSAFQVATTSQREELSALFRDRHPPHTPRIRQMLESLGTRERTAAAAAVHVRDALDAIHACGFAPACVREFTDVAQHVIERQR